MFPGARATVAAALALMVLLGAAACVSGEPSHPSATPVNPPPTAVALLDPALDDRLSTDEALVPGGTQPVLHERGVGSADFRVADLPPHTEQVQFFLACTSGSHFVVSLNGKRFKTACAPRYRASGSIPVTSIPAHVHVQVPAGTYFVLLAVAHSD